MIWPSVIPCPALTSDGLLAEQGDEFMWVAFRLSPDRIHHGMRIDRGFFCHKSIATTIVIVSVKTYG
ncbi:MAG: hypothetical protein RIR21_1781 [Pseudomonadota bacterium]|jgi:hypothetical protein